MVHKFRTDAVSVAFKANSTIPRDYRQMVEHDIDAMIRLYSTAFMIGKRNDFVQAMGEFAKNAMIAFLVQSGDVIATAAPAITSPTTCAHCKGAHATKDH